MAAARSGRRGCGGSTSGSTLTPRRSTSPSSVLPAPSSASAPRPSSNDLAAARQARQCRQFCSTGAGRDIQWAILDELFKAKSPKVVVLEVDEQPYPFGHFFFRYVAPAEAIVFPPTPFLHNYLYNLAYLPVRKLKLFGANLFPDLFGLSKAIRSRALRERTAPTSRTSFIGEFGKLVDMEHPIPRETLLAQPREPVPRTRWRAAFTRINGGEDHLFIEKIAREAKAPGAQLHLRLSADVRRSADGQRRWIFSNNSVPCSTMATSRPTTNCSRIGRI